MGDDIFNFGDMLKEAAKEAGVEIKGGTQALGVYLNGRAIHLSTIIGQKGFEKALRAERNNAALRAGLAADDAASAADRFVLGVVQGALRVAAGVLAG